MILAGWSQNRKSDIDQRREGAVSVPDIFVLNAMNEWLIPFSFILFLFSGVYFNANTVFYTKMDMGNV